MNPQNGERLNDEYREDIERGSVERQEVSPSKEMSPEKRESETSREEETIDEARDELERQASELPMSPEEERAVEEHAKHTATLNDEAKVRHLVQLAKDKGPVYAVKVAKNTDSPYILDALHDVLRYENRSNRRTDA